MQTENVDWDERKERRNDNRMIKNIKIEITYKIVRYSMVSNNCVGWNNYVGGHIRQKLTIV